MLISRKQVALSLVVFGTFAVIGCHVGETEPTNTTSVNSSEVVGEESVEPVSTPFTPAMGDDGEFQLVALSLPNMCCEGCAQSVREALTEVEGISHLEADASTKSARFQATRDVDVGHVLDELSKTNQHIRGWSRGVATAEAGDEAAKASETSST